MSFKCQKCGVAQLPGTRPVRVVVATREREYSETMRVGSEIVEEQDMCEACAEKHNATHDLR